MASHLDANRIARRQAMGGGVASRLDHRAPAPLRNHARDNIVAMRKKQMQLRGRMSIGNLKQPPADFKLKQFENVKSRFAELPRPMPNRPTPCDRRSPCERPPSREEDQRASEEGDDKEDEIDIVTFELECERLKKLHGRKATPPASKPFQKDAAGRPAYLQRMKAEQAEKQRQADEQSKCAQIPPGYRRMPEHERKETLEALQKKREELEKAFQNLPLKIETDSQKRRQQMVLDKIAELDKGIQTYSNPNILIEA